RAAGGPELARRRARQRHCLPHVHSSGTQHVRRAVLQLPARPHAESPTRRAPYVAKGRVPGLTPVGSRRFAARPNGGCELGTSPDQRTAEVAHVPCNSLASHLASAAFTVIGASCGTE